MPFGGGGPFGGHATLGDVAVWWKMNEESGVRVDEVGSNDLIDNNTVGYAAGKIGNAASMVEARTEWLSRDAGVGEQVIDTSSGAWSFSGWAYCDTADYTHGRIALNCDNGADNLHALYFIWYKGPARLWLNLYDTTGASKQIRFAAADGVVDPGWNHFAFWVDGDGKLRGSCNNNTPLVSAALANPARAARRIGLAATVSGGLPVTIKWDLAGAWDRALIESERTDLFNSGDGLDY